MEVRKLFYEDSHLQSFSACVTGCAQGEKGFLVELDATAFYPEGGGQACDRGTLGQANVLDVQEKNGRILHLCDRALPVGERVQGTIDWERRFDLMQQHTGEHILSGLIYARYGYHNVGFHVGRQAMEVDFDGPIPGEALAELEYLANQAVWENRPLRCWYPMPEELSQIAYRTKRALPWPVRIVEIPQYDRCACCGVHVRQTGEVGLIKILSCTKFHEGVRLEMLCGKRAYEYLCRVYEENRQVSHIFSAKVLETGEAARTISDALSREKLRAAALQKQVFAAIAEKCVGRENILHFEPDITPGGVRELAEAICQVCTGVAAVYTGSDDRGYHLCLASRTCDVRPLGAEASQNLCGRGGGKAGAFQGFFSTTSASLAQFFTGFFVI